MEWGDGEAAAVVVEEERQGVVGALLYLQVHRYPTLTVVSQAGAKMKRMQMRGAAGRTRGRRCRGVWNQCRGGKNPVLAVQIMNLRSQHTAGKMWLQFLHVMVATKGA